MLRKDLLDGKQKKKGSELTLGEGQRGRMRISLSIVSPAEIC